MKVDARGELTVTELDEIQLAVDLSNLQLQNRQEIHALPALYCRLATRTASPWSRTALSMYGRRLASNPSFVERHFHLAKGFQRHIAKTRDGLFLFRCRDFDLGTQCSAL